MNQESDEKSPKHLPKINQKTIKIDCISDLHGDIPPIPGDGDLIICAGDITSSGKMGQWHDFFEWFSSRRHKKRILVGGNHDNFLEINPNVKKCLDFTYLEDSGCEYKGLKIWGSPWTISFEGMHPLCKAFCLDTDEELARQWAKIPDDTEILITHSPPYGILDMVDDRYNCGNYHVGSKSLLDRIDQLKNLKLVIFGHIHGGYGQIERNGVIFVNASIQTEYFEPVNKPIRIELKQPKTT